ncbi:SDR family NAD(P)-dependent oxidoreductase, partial [Streptomyces sp. NPDC056983]|uniref:SDR family NAD(P)-dependent oxidoreductase n=1 Tax=Streptomyces sp. NPDC056983 TaxID=3345987 RepID=UPI00362AC6CF
MDLGLKDRVYVVTGATRGLGNAAARELVADGAKVIITGRDEKRVAEAAEALGENAVGVAADNADPAVARRLIDAAREHFGGVERGVLVVGGPAPRVRAGQTHPGGGWG